MASISLEAFLPEIMLESSGVPAPVALNAIRNACYDFCRKSLVWNEVQSAVAYTAGVTVYQPTPPTDAQVISVLHVNVDSTLVVYPYSTEEVAMARPNWQSFVGNIEGFVQPDRGTIRFFSVPQSSGTFAAMVAYAPKRNAKTIDDLLFNVYLESIKYGALWKLKIMPGKPWSDPAGAQYYERAFNTKIGEATIDRTRGNTRTVLRVAPRSFV
jgi:hypothetical protein